MEEKPRCLQIPINDESDGIDDRIKGQINLGGNGGRRNSTTVVEYGVFSR